MTCFAYKLNSRKKVNLSGSVVLKGEMLERFALCTRDNLMRPQPTFPACKGPTRQTKKCAMTLFKGSLLLRFLMVFQG